MDGDDEAETIDPRVREHAETAVDWSLRVASGEQVLLRVDDGAHDLAVAAAEAIGERGAVPIVLYASDAVRDAYLAGVERAVDEDDPDATGDGRDRDDACFPAPTAERTLYESVDKVLAIEGSAEPNGAEVAGETRSAYRRSRSAVRDVAGDTPTMITVHPTEASARSVGMSPDEYREFVYGAVLRDWESLAADMDRLKEILDRGETVRIVAEGTDVTMRIDGRSAINSAASVAYGSSNLPSGEVFTAPYATEGEVHFDLPKAHRTGSIEGARLTFEGGEVVAFSAEQNEEGLAAILDADPGARRVGELGVGMNRGIDEPVGKVLFDEKMAGTVHLALGRAYDACLPDGESPNDSAVHVDLLTSMGEGSRIEVDGEPIQRDGVFRWEDAPVSDDR